MAEQGCQEAVSQLLRNTLPERLRQCERAGRRAANALSISKPLILVQRGGDLGLPF